MRMVRLGALTLAMTALALGAVLVDPEPSYAVCEPGSPDPLTTWDPPPPVEVAYGDYWNATAKTNNVVGPAWSGSAVVTGETGAARQLSAIFYQEANSSWCRGNLSVSPGEGRPLSAGTYAITGNFQSNVTYPDGSSSTNFDTPTATLTVSPARLAIEVGISADPANRRHAIISAKFVGAFADGFTQDWGSTAVAEAPLTPAGTWVIVVTDADGSVAFETEISRTETEDSLATSAYWIDPPAGEYDAQASFVLQGESARNFVMAESTSASFTAAGPPSEALPDATSTPIADAGAGGATLSLGILLALGVVVVGGAAVATLRMGRGRRNVALVGDGDGREEAS